MRLYQVMSIEDMALPPKSGASTSGFHIAAGGEPRGKSSGEFSAVKQMQPSFIS